MVDQAEIHRKTVSFGIEERLWAAEQLRSDFADLPDREEAWEDLYKLTQDEDWAVRSKAALALGSAFQHIPDKEAAWEDLIKLTQDEDSGVRSHSYYSIGRINILEASKANENEIKKYLDTADIEEYNKSVEAYERMLSGRTAISDPIEYTELNRMYNGLDRVGGELELYRGELGLYRWAPLGGCYRC